MNKAASLSLAASLALVVIPAGTATASEVNAQTLRKNVAIKRVLISQPGTDRMLNPQPLPPKAKFGQSVKFSDPLNPQPLPPKEKFGQIVKYSDPLNPQPLPPKEKFGQTVKFSDPLNPQPLPPKERMTRSFINNVNIRALNPQPLPPKAGQIAKFSDPLNPQPLPPKEKFNVAFKDTNASAFKSMNNIRALNPQPLPPKAGQMVR